MYNVPGRPKGQLRTWAVGLPPRGKAKVKKMLSPPMGGGLLLPPHPKTKHSLANPKLLGLFGVRFAYWRLRKDQPVRPWAEPRSSACHPRSGGNRLFAFQAYPRQRSTRAHYLRRRSCLQINVDSLSNSTCPAFCDEPIKG